VRREGHGLEPADGSAVNLVAGLFAKDTSPSNSLARKERSQRLTAALASLAPRDREVLTLRHLEQRGTAQIAAALGITEGAVKARLLRALLRLRDRMESDS
jgi:RNA polymerase sigma-70 factor (ECF subfamily)